MAPQAPGEGRHPAAIAPHPPLHLRPLLLPNEHGGWGFLFEPIVLAGIAAPSLAGFLVALAAVAAFLARHPLKLAAADVVRGRRYPRTIACANIAAAYSLVGLLALGGAVYARGWHLLIPLAIAAPFGLIQLAFDAKNRGRAALPEIAGAMAMGGVASSMAIAASLPLALAVALWLVALCRSLPAIAYVRAVLGRGRGAVAAHVVAIAVIASLWFAKLAPLVAIIAAIVLLGRALFPPASPVAKRVGVAELVWGGAATIATGLAYLLR